MQERIVLISDDSDFFEYISPKLKLRKSDELFRFSFDEIPDKFHLINSSLLIINSENSEDKTLELLEIVKGTPAIVFSFNDNEDFRVNAYKKGMLDYITLSTSDDELEAKLIPALNIISSIEKSNVYRDMLVKNNIVAENNEVFLDYINILDKEIAHIKENSENAVLVAISPNDKTKFLLKSNQIETNILNNIRKNDILMNFAPNKYFLLLYNTNVEEAQKIWSKIRTGLQDKVYAGFAQISYKNRQQIINEVLNKLHEAINRDDSLIKTSDTPVSNDNFKFQKQNFNKKFEKIITPVFYRIQQMYNDKLFGMNIKQEVGKGFGNIYIKGKYSEGNFKITSPGQSKINIDITYKSTAFDKKTSKFPQAKRITLEPDELEPGLLEDLLEQFITEFKSEVNNVNT